MHRLLEEGRDEEFFMEMEETIRTLRAMQHEFDDEGGRFDEVHATAEQHGMEEDGNTSDHCPSDAKTARPSATVAGANEAPRTEVNEPASETSSEASGHSYYNHHDDGRGRTHTREDIRATLMRRVSSSAAMVIGFKEEVRKRRASSVSLHSSHRSRLIVPMRASPVMTGASSTTDKTTDNTTADSARVERRRSSLLGAALVAEALGTSSHGTLDPLPAATPRARRGFSTF